MIQHLFLDLDNTLLFSSVHGFKGWQHKSEFPGCKETYYTVIRRTSLQLVDFCREAVGVENTFILTAASNDYALRMNEIGELGFTPDRIISREQAEQYRVPGCYGGTQTIRHALWSPSNLLVDDLLYHRNPIKVDLMGISKEHYIEVIPYYGGHRFDKHFLDKTVRELLKRIKNENNKP